MPEASTNPTASSDRRAAPVFGRTGMSDGGNGGADASSLLYLCVFILLLAFFILLNSISNFHDEKVGAVLSSVDHAFSSQALLTGAAGDRQQVRLDAARAVADLGDLIRAELPLAKVEAGTETGTLQVVLPVAAMFTADGGAIRPGRQGLMDRMARALEPRRPGVAVRAEMLFATRGITDTAPLVAQAGVLARSLTGLGANPAWLSVGLEKGQAAGELRMMFAVRATEGR